MTKQYGFHRRRRRAAPDARPAWWRACDKNGLDGRHGSSATSSLMKTGGWRQDRMTGAWHQDVTAPGYVSDRRATTATIPHVKVCPTKAHCEARRQGRPSRHRPLPSASGAACARRPAPTVRLVLDEKARKMTKCDACVDRVVKGELPVCVAACPQRAISFGRESA